MVQQLTEMDTSYYSAVMSLAENPSAGPSAMLEVPGAINVPKSCDVLAERLQLHILCGDYRILEAIGAGDGDAARRRAERDVQAYARHLEAAVQTAEGIK